MPNQIVFVLTSSGLDMFARMQTIALQTVRFHMRSANVLLLVDGESHDEISKNVPSFFDLFDETKKVDTPPGNGKFRNRWVKTCMRKQVDGDFLYLDADLVVRGDLAPVWDAAGEFAGVRNGNVSSAVFSNFERQRYSELDWRLPLHGSINGGVLFWRDSKATHDLSDAYRKRWLENKEKTGRVDDQQALNRAICDCAIQPTFLETKYNTMEVYPAEQISSAHIWHFIFSKADDHGYSTIWERTVSVDTPLPPASFWSQIKHPWIVDGPVSFIAARSLTRSPARHTGLDWRRLWLSGRRLSALKTAILLASKNDARADVWMEMKGN